MRLTIIGASGHGKVVADIAQLNGYDDIRFLDDDPRITSCGDFPVIGPSAGAASITGDLFVAIGNAVIRKKFMEQYSDKRFPVLVHPSSVVASTSRIGIGSVVMAGAIVNPYASIGRGCIINTSASVDHDCTIDNYVHISVGARVCGTVTIDEGTWIGAGATISNNLTIRADAMVGAGAVVVKDIPAHCVAVGNPAKPIRFFE